MPVAELQGLLTCDNKPFIRSMDESVSRAKTAGGQISGAFSGMGPQLAAAFSIGAAVSFGKAVLDFAGNLTDSAERLNLNAEALQGLQGAFEQAGASGADVTKGLTVLSEKLSSFEDDTEAADKVLAGLGLTFADIKGQKLDEVVFRLADAFKTAEDRGAALAALTELMGKAGPKMAAGLNQGSEALRKMSDEVSKLSDEARERLDALGDTFTGLGKSALVYAGTYLALLVKDFEDLIRVANKAAGLSIGNLFGAPPGDVKTPTDGREFPTAQARPNLTDEEPGTQGGGGHARGRKLSEGESAKMDEQRAEEEKAGEDQKKGIEERNKLEAEHFEKQNRLKAEARRIARDGLFDELSGEEKLAMLTKERAQIMEEAARLGAYTGEQEVEYAKKSVEIAKQIRENDWDKKDMSEAAAAASSAASGSLRTGGLTTGHLSDNAHSAVRAGDAARRREAAKKEKDGLAAGINATAANTAALAKAWGATGTTP